MQLARGAAKMVLACLPRLSGPEAAPLFGADPAAAGEEGGGSTENPAARAGTGLVTADGSADLGA